MAVSDDGGNGLSLESATSLSERRHLCEAINTIPRRLENPQIHMDRINMDASHSSSKRVWPVPPCSDPRLNAHLLIHLPSTYVSQHS